MQIEQIKPIKRKKNLSVRVANQIERMIFNGEIKVGEKLPSEKVLCDNFRVSRTVIREAISFLNAKGLLYAQAGDGTYIKEIGSTEVADVLALHINQKEFPEKFDQFIEVRKILEENIAEIAAVNASEKNIQLINTNLKEMKGLIGNPEEFAKKDLEFHVLLAKSTENPLFEIMLKPLIQSLLNVIRMALVYEPSSKEAIEFHNAIYRAIKNRDPQRARVSMSNHMNQTCAAVKSAIKNLVKE